MIFKSSYLRNYLFLLLVLLTLACGEKPKEGFKVIGVKDGDTVELLMDNKPVTVRLYGVDCPEKKQDFGTQARKFTSDLAYGKFVRLEQKGTDRYGRTIGEIFLPDGKSLNKELVANGYAWYYRAYANDPQLGYLENDARRLERGLWSQPNPVAPWDFRKNKREKSQAASQKPIAKPADADREVFICPTGSASTYHTRPDCPVLKRCKGQIEVVTRGTAVVNLRRTACKVCSKKK
ncbi:thermonuclease family protein [Adhaeribacter soli]|uniref:Thermonuclease family protein n=1 Tax=Adhaeribacter soli TaxID=2607655 RepID=A0A5N1J215_9BACT|nr:thermonuclease family protein [Adhaeribacter soli]KAA9340536.1 thermonuclease family protein [Adhaeribacter soli]